MELRLPSPPRSAVAVALALLLLPGCGERLPTAPAALATGIAVHEDANFSGESAHITRDLSDLSAFFGPCRHPDPDPDYPDTYDWEDCISSVRVAPGWRARLYRDRGYRGDSLDITADVPDLQLAPGNCSKGGLNDCVSSVRLIAQ
jgi:hypothetical protein